MDTTRFKNQLKQSLNDPTSATWSAAAIDAAMNRAVREYSRYYPLLRRYGIGSIYADINAGATSVQVVGGTYAVGDTITLSYLGDSETKTITAVAASATDDKVNTPVTLSFTATAKAHKAGARTKAGTLGLAIVNGTDTYALPLDFVEPDQESFDLAVGAKAEVKRTSVFYDAVYTIAQQLSSVGIGRRMTYGVGVVGAGFPIAGNPYNNPNVSNNRNPLATIFRFTLDALPSLIVSPAPTADTTLDFYYKGLHIAETVPDHAMEALLAYARYSCLMGLANEMSSDMSFTEGDITEDPSKSVAALKGQAMEAMKEFDIKIRLRPHLVSG